MFCVYTAAIVYLLVSIRRKTFPVMVPLFGLWGYPLHVWFCIGAQEYLY